MATLFLASVLGWYLVITSIFLLTRRDKLNEIVTEVVMQRGLIFILALITLILGLMMVVSHNIWVMGWPVLVTILSWLVLISGILRLFFPEMMVRMGKNMLAHANYTIVTGIISLLIGLFLLYKVYFG